MESVRIILCCFILFLVMVSVLSVVTCAEFRKKSLTVSVIPFRNVGFLVSFLSLTCRLSQTGGFGEGDDTFLESCLMTHLVLVPDAVAQEFVCFSSALFLGCCGIEGLS